MKFVIFHGSYSTIYSNWFPYLKESLEDLGQEVILPQFPIDNFEEIKDFDAKTKQNLNSWLKVFERDVYPIIKNDKRLIFVGHSLGPLFILHILERYKIKLDTAIFVVPFYEKLGKSIEIDAVNKTFYRNDFDWYEIKKLINNIYVLYSENDPYVAESDSKKFAKMLNASQIKVRGSGHMNSEINLNEFPLVLELCKSRLDLSLYQKYIAHKKELYSLEKIDKYEDVITMDPFYIQEEGIFHFRNLKKSGFMTFLTSTKYWDRQSRYMREGRIAAGRVPMTRVFVYEDQEDFKRVDLKNQIKLDKEAGIKTYKCNINEVQGLSKNPDFGIWDEEYVCMVEFDKNNKAQNVVLNSRKEVIDKFVKLKEEIIKNAEEI